MTIRRTGTGFIVEAFTGEAEVALDQLTTIVVSERFTQAGVGMAAFLAVGGVALLVYSLLRS